MKKILFAATILMGILSACDDTTDTLGASLTNPADHLTVSVDTFTIGTQSVKANPVLCRSFKGYLGKIKDPETGNYVTGDFMTQLAPPSNNFFHPIDSLLDKKIYAYQCELVLYFTKFYGDSLTSMKATVYEMDRPYEEKDKYYSDFDPLNAGMVRNNGIKAVKTYNMIDYCYTDSMRNTSTWWNNIRIPLNDEYTDKDGKVYNNYGTYLMTKYYEKPDAHGNTYAFTHDVCPGFFVKTTGGVGAMAEIDLCQMNIYYKVKVNENAETINYFRTLGSTEEVLQGTRLTNNDNAMDELIKDTECTYVKSPAGIYTELTLPVLDIMKGHEKDSISSARLVMQALNDKTPSNYNLPKPKQLLLIERDSLTEFFEQGHVTDYERTYVSALSSKNEYIFSNINILVERLYREYNEGIKAEGQNWLVKHPDWNKVLLVPVVTETTTTSYGTTTTIRVAHDLSPTSTRLIGGANNPNAPVRLSVIYSKFEE